MCVLAFAWHAHPSWPLVLAGNRDELHERPAAPLVRWAQPAHLLAGRDLKSGGTWLGVSELGRLAVVTNLAGYGAPDPRLATRGALVTDVLLGTDPPLQGVDLSGFNPFNLITADPGSAYFLSNRPHDIRCELDPGIYGLANGALGEAWPKTIRLETILGQWLDADSDRIEILLDALRQESPDTSIGQSANPEERYRSSIFIRNPLYGTRCSTVVVIDRGGHGRIVERRYDPSGEAVGETALTFSWPL